MKAAIATLLLVLCAGSALAASPVERMFAVPLDRMWTVTQAVLKHMGWDIDKTDRTIGFITTESRSVNGENYGVYAKGVRHRLHVELKAAGSSRTQVRVERTIFKRERILFVDKDEPLTTTDTNVEKALLDALARAL